MAFERETRKSRGPAKGKGGAGSRGGAGKKSFGDKKAFGDKPKRSFDDKPKRAFGDSSKSRAFGDKPRGPRKDFGDRPPRREGSSEDRPRRAYNSDRPKRDFSNSSRDGARGDRPPRKDFGDRPARRTYDSDRPRRDFDDRPKRDFGDRKPRRDFDPDRPRKRFDDERPQKRFDEDRPRKRFDDDRPRKRFEDRPRREERDFDDRPKRSFGERPARKKFDDDFKPAKREGFEKRPSKEFKEEASREESKNEPLKGHELLLYGVHAVHAALRNKDRKVTSIWVTESGEERLKEAWDAKRHPAPEVIERRDLDRRLTAGAVHQGMAIAVEPLQDVFLSDILASASRADERQVVILLDEVTDPHNIGAVLRSMSAFGAKAMVVHKRNAPGITGVMAKIATGAVETVPMIAVTNLAQAMEELKIAGFFILGLDENADYPIQKAPKDGHIALVLGAEGEGLRAKTRATCDAIASIETFGEIKSLNVSNAAAIALYALTQK